MTENPNMCPATPVHSSTSPDSPPYPGPSPRRIMPGPKGLPVVGVAPWIVKDPFGYLPRLATKYGDVVDVPMPGMKLVLISHPDHVNHVMNKFSSRYEIAPFLRDAVTDEPDFPTFHGALEGEPWRRVRKALNPRFSTLGIAELSEVITDGVADCVDTWSGLVANGNDIDLAAELDKLTMSVLFRSMFSTPADRETVEEALAQFEMFAHSALWKVATKAVPSWIPLPQPKRFRESNQWVRDYLDRMIADRRQHPTEDPDLLNTLLATRFTDDSQLSDPELRAELRGLIVAGTETTSSALAWTLAFLEQNPEALERANAEVDALGGARVGGPELASLPWLKACFEEAQRLQGFQFVMAREAVEDDEIDGYHIPKGTMVGYSGYGLYRDPRFWKNPDSFNPSRFFDDDINRLAFPLFGIGKHRCLGMRWAQSVGIGTLATLLQRYRLESDPDSAPKHAAGFGAAKLRGGLKVRLTARPTNR